MANVCSIWKDICVTVRLDIPVMHARFDIIIYPGSALMLKIIQMRAYDEDLLFVFDKDWKTNFDEQQARILHYQLSLFITSLIVFIFIIIGTIWIRRYDKKYIKLKKTRSTNSK